MKQQSGTSVDTNIAPGNSHPHPRYIDKVFTKIIPITGTLFLFSLGLHFWKGMRPERNFIGQEVFAGIGLDGITEFEITARAGTMLKLERQTNSFSIPIEYQDQGNKKTVDYIASNEKVNDLFFRLASLEIKDVLTRDLEKRSDFKLDEKEFKLKVVMKGKGGGALHTAYIGDEISGRGTPLYKKGDDKILLTKGSLFVSTDKVQYVNSQPLKEDPQNIRYGIVKGERIERQEESQKAVDSSKKEYDLAKFDGWLKEVLQLRFTAIETTIGQSDIGKNLNNSIVIAKENGQVFRIQFGPKGDKFFVSFSSFKDPESETQVTIGQDTGKERLKEIEQLMISAKDVENFQRQHSNWIYEISKQSFDQLSKGTEQIFK